MQIDMNNKTVVVTGAAGGIGSAIVSTFAAAAANVLATDLAVAKINTEVESCAADIATMEGAQQVIAHAIEKFGQVDVLVNCAGISEPSLLEETTEESWQRVLNVNLTAPWRLSQAVMPELKKTRCNIVNIASFAGKRATLFGDNASYTASKSGIIGLTYALALECAPAGVRVNAVAPAPVNTRMLQTLPQGKRDLLTDMIPLGVLPEPCDIANAVLFLASRLASCITGEIMDVNGGMYLD